MTDPRQDPPRTLEAVRSAIDALDHELLQLLARRRALVAEAFAFKRAHGLPRIDPQRESALVAERRSYAEALGLPADVTEALFRAVLEGSHRQDDDA